MKLLYENDILTAKKDNNNIIYPRQLIIMVISKAKYAKEEKTVMKKTKK